ncbi:MAG: toll/interleukin-1 receptor domain-containing protein [Prevotellaceae bacterium]|nr:toll/interleukin-1 receptor domain-containing protein [Candidatus Faecinaster equi]
MGFISRGQLKRVTDSYRYPINETRMFSSECGRTVFLSHKHEEGDLLFRIKVFLENQGVDVYIDWLDPNMRHKTNGKTADDLQTKICTCNKFIFVATELALESTWCSWEVGYADAVKDETKDIAILPIVEDNKNWKGSEYLQDYPTIEYRDGKTKYTNGQSIPEGYYIRYPHNRTIISLNKWLRQ